MTTAIIFSLMERKTIYLLMNYGKRKTKKKEEKRSAIISQIYCASAIIFSLLKRKTIYFSMKYGKKRETRRAICSKNYCASAIILSLLKRKTIFFSMKYGKRKTRRAICSKNYCASAIIFPEELLAMEVLLCTENIWRSSSFATRYIECITTIHHLLILPNYDIKSIKYINNRYKHIND